MARSILKLCGEDLYQDLSPGTYHAICATIEYVNVSIDLNINPNEETILPNELSDLNFLVSLKPLGSDSTQYDEDPLDLNSGRNIIKIANNVSEKYTLKTRFAYGYRFHSQWATKHEDPNIPIMTSDAESSKKFFLVIHPELTYEKTVSGTDRNQSYISFRESQVWPHRWGTKLNSLDENLQLVAPDGSPLTLEQVLQR